MTHQRPTDEMLELAALYALGVLNPEDAVAFEAHLAKGCRVCDREVNAFAAVVVQLGGAEGVVIKPLFSDPARGTLTALVRMQAGSRLPRHRHVTVEQFYMLEGDGHVVGQVLQAGDYFRAAAGTVHEVMYTEGGCVFLLIASRVEVLG